MRQIPNSANFCRSQDWKFVVEFNGVDILEKYLMFEVFCTNSRALHVHPKVRKKIDPDRRSILVKNQITLSVISTQWDTLGTNDIYVYIYLLRRLVDKCHLFRKAFIWSQKLMSKSEKTTFLDWKTCFSAP